MKSYLTYPWDASEIQPGIYFYRHDGEHNIEDNLGYYASVLSKIGYVQRYDEDKKYIYVSMTDGLALFDIDRKDMLTGYSPEKLAQHLTEHSYIPVPYDHLNKILQYLATRQSLPDSYNDKMRTMMAERLANLAEDESKENVSSAPKRNGL